MRKGQVKHHSEQYRNLNGKYFQCWTANQEVFEQEIAEFKTENRAYRIIEGQLYREIKKGEKIG